MIRDRLILAAAVILALGSLAAAQITGPIGGASGVFPGGPEFGITGAAVGPGGASSTPATSCDQTGFDFSNACNGIYFFTFL